MHHERKEVKLVHYIKLRDVSKSFGNHTVLRNLTFHVQQGEILGLLGPNGSGKTTIIRLLNGLLSREAGEVSVNGLDPLIDGDTIRAMSGTLTEEAGLYEHLSGIDNLTFFAELYGIGDRMRIATLLDQFDLTAHQHKKVGTYSTGMKKRLGLAKVLLHEPDLLFLDEPTNGLDPDGIQTVLRYIGDLNREYGTTVVICSHILYQLESLCHRYVLIEQGNVIEEGTLSQIEAKHLQEIKLRVETSFQSTTPSFAGHRYERLSEEHILFTLPNKSAIPPLIQQLSTEAAVYSAEIINRDLETLYFRARRKQRDA